jgi:hypothetical protein
MGSEDAELQAHYVQGKEWDRLDDPKSAIGFERTKEILQRRLPAAPAVIADVGWKPMRAIPSSVVTFAQVSKPSRR